MKKETPKFITIKKKTFLVLTNHLSLTIYKKENICDGRDVKQKKIKNNNQLSTLHGNPITVYPGGGNDRR